MAKRIIDGKTYNTDTATKLAAETPAGQHRAQFDELYQTRHGAYFRYHGDLAFSTDAGPLEDIQPLTPPEAQLWMENHGSAALVEKHFGEQPEAGESESRITLRIPDALKTRIETTAAAHNQSLNAWIIRCVEKCAHEGMTLTGLAVQSNLTVDNKVVVKANIGKLRVVAEINQEDIHDYFGNSSEDQQCIAVIRDNLVLIGRAMAEKYEKGHGVTEGRYGSNLRLLSFTSSDLPVGMTRGA